MFYSVHYTLIDEVIDVSKNKNWNYTVFENRFKNNSFSETIDKEKLFGIAIYPLGCEPYCFTFL